MKSALWVAMSLCALLISIFIDAAAQNLSSHSSSLPIAVRSGAFPGVGGDSAAYHVKRAGDGFESNQVTQLAELTASDAVEDDQFGISVAMSGNTIVVGAPFHPVQNSQQGPGAAYVFVKPLSGWGNLTQTAELTASDGQPFNQFGYSVAIDKNTIVVGADVAAVGTNQAQGAAYVFVKPPGGWTNMTETAKLTASDGSANNQFGFSVSISGNTVAVGAIGNPNGTYQGAGYVFVEPATGWASMTQTAELAASDAVLGDEFGFSASLSGNTAVFGVRGLTQVSGSAYVFVEPAAGWSNMTQTAKLTASDGSPGDGLGYSTSIAGRTVLVGSPYKTGTYRNQGAGYVFVEPNSGWTNMTETAELTSRLGQNGGLLGFSAFTTGNIVLLAAPGSVSNAVFAYVKPPNGWVSSSAFKARVTNFDKTSNFGYSVSMSGKVGVVGAPDENAQEGAAYVFGQQ